MLARHSHDFPPFDMYGQSDGFSDAGLPNENLKSSQTDFNVRTGGAC